MPRSFAVEMSAETEPFRAGMREFRAFCVIMTQSQL
jgi:hypothetical protein